MKSRNNKKVAIVVLLIIAMLAFILKPFVFNEPKSGKIKSTDREIPFRHEGNLQFLIDSTSIKTIEIEVAASDLERGRGLMYRKNMPENRGMLFLFDEARIQNFYMKNTYIPLDIIYVDANRKVVSIQKQTTPLSELTLPSEAPAQYVVEVNGGFCDKYGIDKGTQVEFEIF